MLAVGVNVRFRFGDVDSGPMDQSEPIPDGAFYVSVRMGGTNDLPAISDTAEICVAAIGSGGDLAVSAVVNEPDSKPLGNLERGVAVERKLHSDLPGNADIFFACGRTNQQALP